MAKSFQQLRAKMTPEQQQRSNTLAQAMLLEMALQELRQSRNMTQQQVASMMNLSQAALSKMEKQSDIQVGTLRRILATMGAQLKLVAEFPDGEVVINQFGSSSTSLIK